MFYFSIAVNRVATFRELDNDLLRHAAFLTLDNEIDLKHLAKWLSAESEVIEVSAEQYILISDTRTIKGQVT